jgi:hypothetical protein
LAAADAEHHAGAAAVSAPSDVAPLQLLEFSGLAAVVRSVRLDDFSLTTLQERLQSGSALEAMARSHNSVIEAIHTRQAILPAKFGMVHARAEDVLSALEPAHDALLRQLTDLEGRDEWAVHLYADRAVISERISREEPRIRDLREKRAAARPGRGYFLDQQIRDELESATDSALLALAQDAFDRLLALSRDGQPSPNRRAMDLVGIEILRASFLVTREGAEAFTDEVQSIGAADGVRCEFSGPWPPYSFAACGDEAAR